MLTFSTITMNFKEPYEVIVNRLAHWIQFGIDYLPSAIVALIVFLLFYLVARFSSRFFARYIGTHMESRTFAGLLAFFIKMLIIFMGLYFAIEILDFNEAIISLLAGAGIAGLILGLAFQELITNLISGVSLTIKKYFHLGDQISINNHLGYAQALDLRATVLRGVDGTMITMPNKDVLQSVVTNFFTSGTLRKELFIGIPSTQDIGRISEVLKEAISNLDFLHKDNKTEVLFIDVENSIVKLLLRYWIIYPIPGLAERAEEHFTFIEIKKVFDKYQLALPNYIRNHEFKQELVLMTH